MIDERSPGVSWDPEQYLRFKAERERPFVELLARLPAGPCARLVDLGCGTGALTQLLAQRYPGAQVWGLDRSQEMLARACELEVPPRVRFVRGDLARWQPDGPVDGLVANAVLQWVPDHGPLLQRLCAVLSAGGFIAAQLPRRRGPVDGVLQRMRQSGPWREALAELPRPHCEEPLWYLQQLASLGLQVDLWETQYYHQLPDSLHVVEWLKGTTLRPALTRLPAEATREMLLWLGRELEQVLPRGGGQVVLPFRRLFFVGRRA